MLSRQEIYSLLAFQIFSLFFLNFQANSSPVFLGTTIAKYKPRTRKLPYASFRDKHPNDVVYSFRNPMIPANTLRSEALPPARTSDSSHIATLLHSLSNKLLPIVVFSELALRRCEDTQLRSQLEKIHGAAEQARELLFEIRNVQSRMEP